MQLKEVKKGSRRKKSSKESASKFFAKNKTDIILSVFLFIRFLYLYHSRQALPKRNLSLTALKVR